MKEKKKGKMFDAYNDKEMTGYTRFEKKMSIEDTFKALRARYTALEVKFREQEKELEMWKRTTAKAHELYLKEKALAETWRNRYMEVVIE